MSISSPGSGSMELMQKIEVLEKSQEYSYEEKCIGTWVDGKPLYRRMINFGALPAKTTKTIQMGIENIKHSHVDLGRSVWTKDNSMISNALATYTFIHPYIQFIATNGDMLLIETTATDAENYFAYVCVEYTKSTD